MKKIVLLMTALLLVCSGASAQNNVLNRLKNRAKNAAEQNIGNKIEKGVNDILDGKLGKNKDKKENDQQQRQNQQQVQAGGEDEAADGAVTPQQQRGTAAKIDWNSYDFVAGDEIIFEDTMENEQVGEFPSQWDIFGGYAQIAVLNGVKCISLSDDGAITPLFNDGKPYLTDQFTIEYDVWIVYGPDYNTAFNPHSWVLHTYLPNREKIGSPANFRGRLSKESTQPEHEERKVRDAPELSTEAFDLGVERFG